MQDFRNLKVWQYAHQLVLDVYGATAAFPRAERYGLSSQMRRAAVSIPSNIAEGCGRGSDADFARFLSIAMGSASELEYQLLLARDLGWLHAEDYDVLHEAACRTRRLLNGLLRRLHANS